MKCIWSISRQKWCVSFLNGMVHIHFVNFLKTSTFLERIWKEFFFFNKIINWLKYQFICELFFVKILLEVEKVKNKYSRFILKILVIKITRLQTFSNKFAIYRRHSHSKMILFDWKFIKNLWIILSSVLTNKIKKIDYFTSHKINYTIYYIYYTYY